MQVNRRQVAGAVAAVLAMSRMGYGRNPRGGSPTSNSNYLLGASLGGINSYGPNYPFLNLFKHTQAYNANTFPLDANGAVNKCWATTTSVGGLSTSEECYLNLDANGYLKTLVGINMGSHTQTFTATHSSIALNNPALAPGQTYVYPPGTYRLQGLGTGVLVFFGGGMTAATANSNCTVSNSGNQYTFTSTATGASVWNATVTLNGTGSLSYGITSTGSPANSATNYLQQLSLVQTQYTSIYDSGSYFNPVYINALQSNGTFSVLRFMDWSHCGGNGDNCNIHTNTPSQWTGGIGTLNTAWIYPSGTYPIQFYDNGETLQVTCTAGATAVTYTPTTTTIPSATPYIYSSRTSWSQRYTPSYLSYADVWGVPYEVQIQLCNNVGCNGWFNAPISVDNVFLQQLSTLLASTLVGGLTAEFSNEVWDPGTDSSTYGNFQAQATYGSNSEQARLAWFGYRTAAFATALYTAYGATAYANKITVSMGAQATNNSTIDYALAPTGSFILGGVTPVAQTPARITAVHISFYIGSAPMNAAQQTDITTMSQNADGGVADFLAEQYGYTGKYTSTPAGGYIASRAGEASSAASHLSSTYGSYGLKLLGYEVGDQWGVTGTTWPGIPNNNGGTGNNSNTVLLTSAPSAGAVNAALAAPFSAAATGYYYALFSDGSLRNVGKLTNGVSTSLSWSSTAGFCSGPLPSNVTTSIHLVDTRYALIQVLHCRSPNYGTMLQTFYRALRNAGVYEGNVFVEIASTLNAYGTFIGLENFMQLTDSSGNLVPFTSLPSAWQGIKNYITQG
jgi:hypothetical protein